MATHANALTGVLNAWFDGAPMLLITGIEPLQSLGWGEFQDFNPVAIPIWDRGSIPESMAEFMGVIGTAAGSPELLADADLILPAGIEFDYRAGHISTPTFSRINRICTYGLSRYKLALISGSFCTRQIVTDRLLSPSDTARSRQS